MYCFLRKHIYYILTTLDLLNLVCIIMLEQLSQFTIKLKINLIILIYYFIIIQKKKTDIDVQYHVYKMTHV